LNPVESGTNSLGITTLSTLAPHHPEHFACRHLVQVRSLFAQSEARGETRSGALYVGMTARSHSRGHNRLHERRQRKGLVMSEPPASPDAGGRDFDAAGTHGLMATPRPVTRERPLGYWAFGCLFLTALSLATALTTFWIMFCVGNTCNENGVNYTPLFWMGVVGFVAGVVTTAVLAVWALVQNRQPRWAVSALVILIAPFAYVVVVVIMKS
jgi:hypothetical protein